MTKKEAIAWFILMGCCLFNAWAQTTVGGASSIGGVTQLGGVTTGGGGGTPAGCGYGFDQTDCGNVGDPYEGGSYPAHTDVGACGTLTPAGSPTYYQLTNNIGADATATCITIYYPAGTFSIDLNGKTITGGINVQTNNLSGSIILNGTVNCDLPDSSGCVYVYSEQTPSAQVRLHHLAINNVQIGSRGIQVAWQPPAVGTPAYPMRMDHLEGTIPSQPTSGRCYFANFDGGQKIGVEYDHNYVAPPADAAAFQALSAYAAPGSYVHHNRVVLPHPTYDLGSYDTARAILFDSQGKATGGASTASYNSIVVDENRGLRVRNEINNLVHHNEFLNIRLGGRLGCLHVGEEDLSSEQSSAEAYSNAFEINDGNAAVVTGSTTDTLNFHDNVITCYGGNCASAAWVARTDAVFAGVNGGALTSKNNTIPGTYGNAVGACGTGGGLTCTEAASVSTLTYHATGTIVCGTGATCTDVP